MKKVILFFICLFSASVFAQTTKVRKYNTQTGMDELYYVLKADKQTKEGKFEGYNRTNKLVCEGSYKNNLRDGLWKYYDWRGSLLDSGRYQQDKKIGVWSAYNDRAELLVQYDYTNNNLLFTKPVQGLANRVYRVINGQDTLKKHLQRPPIFLDGSGLLYSQVLSTFLFPASARRAGIQGKVIVAFVIDQDGRVINHRIKQSVGGGCDEEALRMVKMINGNWLPGILNGNPVSVEYEMPVSFIAGN